MKIIPDEIYTLKMNSGEEIIARVLEISDDQITVDQPLSVAPSPQGMALVPGLFTADPDKPVILNTHSISMYAQANELVQKKYIEATTGLHIPEKKILTS